MKKNEIIRKIFQLKTIAVVGLSPNKVRPSHYVSTYMRNNGYNIIPVNPGHDYIEGVRCYPNLESIKEDVDIINIFRKSEFVPDIVCKFETADIASPYSALNPPGCQSNS